MAIARGVRFHLFCSGYIRHRTRRSHLDSRATQARHNHSEHLHIGRSTCHVVNTPFSVSRVSREYTSKIAGIIEVSGTFASVWTMEKVYIHLLLTRENRHSIGYQSNPARNVTAGMQLQ